MKAKKEKKMNTNFTGDCYICTIESLDDIIDTLHRKGCNIQNVVPCDYYFNGANITATRMCITYQRPINTNNNN